MSEFPTIPYQRNRVWDAEIESACRIRETLALRRSVREFSSDPVPMEVITPSPRRHRRRPAQVSSRGLGAGIDLMASAHANLSPLV